ncbi:MAG: hypothetical protein QG608_749 [Actinomycetota bacterium]|nr:hypothetical protein [Actinomycetota bacterium]
MSSPTQSQTPEPAEDEEPAGPGRAPRSTALILVGTTVLLVIVAVVAVVLLGGQEDTADTGPVGQRRSGTSADTGSESLSDTAQGTSTAAGTPRNPFAGGEEDAQATADVSQTSTVPSALPTVSVTVTAPPTGGEALFLGLYGFSKTASPQAQFRVNTNSFSVAVGKPFSSGFTFVKRTAEGCAQVKYGTSTYTLCLGDVVKIQ